MPRMNIYFSGLRDKIRILLAFIFSHLLMYGEKSVCVFDQNVEKHLAFV